MNPPANIIVLAHSVWRVPFMEPVTAESTPWPEQPTTWHAVVRVLAAAWNAASAVAGMPCAGMQPQQHQASLLAGSLQYAQQNQSWPRLVLPARWGCLAPLVAGALVLQRARCLPDTQNVECHRHTTDSRHQCSARASRSMGHLHPDSCFERRPTNGARPQLCDLHPLRAAA